MLIISLLIYIGSVPLSATASKISKQLSHIVTILNKAFTKHHHLLGPGNTQLFTMKALKEYEGIMDGWDCTDFSGITKENLPGNDWTLEEEEEEGKVDLSIRHGRPITYHYLRDGRACNPYPSSIHARDPMTFLSIPLRPERRNAPHHPDTQTPNRERP